MHPRPITTIDPVDMEQESTIKPCSCSMNVVGNDEMAKARTSPGLCPRNVYSFDGVSPKRENLQASSNYFKRFWPIQFVNNIQREWFKVTYLF